MLQLWQISWQAAAVALLVLLLRAVFNRFLTPRCCHALWLLVLVRLLVPTLPQSQFSLFMAETFFRPPLQFAPRIDLPSETSTVFSIEKLAVLDATSRIPISEQAEKTTPFWQNPFALEFIWFTVASFILLRLILTNLLFSRRLKKDFSIPSAALESMLEACVLEMKLYRRPSLRISNLVDSPAVVGAIRPCIVLPANWADSVASSQLRLIFLHELAHIKCNDVGIDWLWAILQSLHWFNPVLWLISPLRRNDREQARDEMVLKIAGRDKADPYGQTLLQIARGGTLPLFCPGLVGIVSNKRCLQRRIKTIARLSGGPIKHGWFGIALICIAGSCALTNPREKPQVLLPEGSAKHSPTSQGLTADVITARLDQHYRPLLEFKQTHFADVIDRFSKILDIPIQVDWPALERAGVGRTAPVNCRLQDIRLSKSLELVLKSVEDEIEKDKLTYRIESGMIRISTVNESSMGLETRRYDINDLLFIPYNASDANTSQKTLSKDDNDHLRATRIEDLKTYIQDNATLGEQQKYAGTITADATGSALFIVDTHQHQQKIQSALDSLKKSRGGQTQVETRLLLIDDSDVQKMPEEIRRRFAALSGAGKDRTDQCLTDGERNQIISFINKSNQTQSLTPPRLTLFDGQCGRITVEDKKAYVKSLTPISGNDDKGKIAALYEPEISTVDDVMWEITCTIRRSPNGQVSFADLHPRYSRLLALIPVTLHWPSMRPNIQGTYQVPVTVAYERSLTCAIPDRTTLLLAGLSQNIADVRDAENQPIHTSDSDQFINIEKQKHLYLMLKTTNLPIEKKPQS